MGRKSDRNAAPPCEQSSRSRSGTKNRSFKKVKKAAQKSRLVNAFARNAAFIAGSAGIAAAGLQTLNRSVLNQEIIVDAMTLSGAALLFSTVILLPADRYPFLKRVSGALGLAYAGLLMADAAGKAGFAGIAISSTLPAITSVAMVFEKHAHQELSAENAASGFDIVKKFKRHPVFYTSMASVLTKPLALSYGLIHGEWLFVGAVIAAMTENIGTAFADNGIRRLFGVGQKRSHDDTPQP